MRVRALAAVAVVLLAWMSVAFGQSLSWSGGAFSGGQFDGGPTFTATPTATATDTRTQTHTYTSTPTATATQTPTQTHTETDTPTQTNTVTQTGTVTETETPGGPTRTHTGTATSTASETLTHTPTSTPTETPTFTATSTPTSTATRTSTPTQTQTATDTETPTDTDTETATETDTVTDTPTVTATATETWTPHAGCEWAQSSAFAAVGMNQHEDSPEDVWPPDAWRCLEFPFSQIPIRCGREHCGEDTIVANVSAFGPLEASPGLVPARAWLRLTFASGYNAPTLRGGFDLGASWTDQWCDPNIPVDLDHPTYDAMSSDGACGTTCTAEGLPAADTATNFPLDNLDRMNPNLPALRAGIGDGPPDPNVPKEGWVEIQDGVLLAEMCEPTVSPTPTLTPTSTPTVSPTVKAAMEEPCSKGASKITLPVALSASAAVLTAPAGQRVYVCGLWGDLSGSGATHALTSGSGTACATDRRVLVPAAASGPALGAGIALAVGDIGASVCIELTGAAPVLNGGISAVIAP